MEPAGAVEFAETDFMKPEVIPLGPLDLMTVAVLIVGILRGRRRGLSQELLPTLQWITIVIVAGLFYEVLAGVLASTQVLSPAFYNLGSYVLIAMAVRIVFGVLKKFFGEKIAGSDFFGRFEYYLGMAAGAVRFTCIYFFLLSFLHAPYYTPDMLAADAKAQEKWFGDIRFPTVGGVQQSFFKGSASGWTAEKCLGNVLVKSMAAPPPDLRGENSVAKRRERDIDALMPGR
jgi:uncharacterized membrane protein required for colicin V production